MKFRVILAFETYQVGNIIEPTGLWRDELLRMRYIEPVVEKPVEIEPEPRRRRKRNENDVIADSL